MSVLALPVVEAVRLPAPSHWRFGRDLEGVAGARADERDRLRVPGVRRRPRRGGPGSRDRRPRARHVRARHARRCARRDDVRPRDRRRARLRRLPVCLAPPARPRGTAGRGGLDRRVRDAASSSPILALYVALGGVRPAARYVLGVLPGAVLLGAYDWAAFGSALHPSYRYVANKYAAAQATGLFGITLPRWHSTTQVLFGDRGILVASPVLLAALVRPRPARTPPSLRSPDLRRGVRRVPAARVRLFPAVRRRLPRSALPRPGDPVPRRGTRPAFARLPVVTTAARRSLPDRVDCAGADMALGERRRLPADGLG